MYVSVSGGRHYTNRRYVNHVLDCIHRETAITTLIQGGARGVDTLAREWAEAHSVPTITVPADWARHGRAAGPRRNMRILQEFHPDVVVVFPGGVGTDHMKRNAIALGFDVLCV